QGATSVPALNINFDKPLAPYLKSEMLLEALNLVGKMKSEEYKSEGLRQLRPYLTSELAIQAEAIEKTISNPVWLLEQSVLQRHIISGRNLKPQGTVVDIKPELRISALSQTLAEAQNNQGLPDEIARLEYMIAALEEWGKTYRLGALVAWRVSLQTLAVHSRAELLKSLAVFIPFALSFLPEEQVEPFLAGVFHAVQSVSRWWQ
ncbi:MAG TPA: hypothetical protein PKG95_04015, partial [Anaerolineaceae bacterium]|nr:hypothetical protein [Anaerolineaceae bacterium]